MCLSAVGPMLLKYNIKPCLHAQSVHTVASPNMSSEISALADTTLLTLGQIRTKSGACIRSS